MTTFRLAQMILLNYISKHNEESTRLINATNNWDELFATIQRIISMGKVSMGQAFELETYAKFLKENL